MSKADYIPAIGVECHVQLKTKTKLFAAVSNDARGAEPNSLISHICVGMPGALPVLNEAAVELAVRAAHALNTQPERFSKFDRKHYFYPDLPKGYQITQYDKPIIAGGYVGVRAEGKLKKISIARVNLEEDAGKTTHPAGGDYSLVDLNRAGTPLLEIVSGPDISSPAQAKAYARELWLLMRYADVTDGDMYHGHVRFDVNVSLAKEGDELGTRTEVKNLNSFKSVESAAAYEIKRQKEVLDRGDKVVQETRGWDEAKQKTTAQREKEEAHDYRYFPEPDIPPVVLSEEYIKSAARKVHNQLLQLRKKLSGLGIDDKVVEDLLDKPEIIPRLLEAMSKTSTENARRIAFQLLERPEVVRMELSYQIKLAEMVSGNELSSTAAKRVLSESIRAKEDPRDIAGRLNLLQISDETKIEDIINKVVVENHKAAADIKKGQAKAIGFLVGQVMKASHGKANPALTQQIIKRKLGIE